VTNNFAPFKGRTEGQDHSVKLWLMHETMLIINPLKTCITLSSTFTEVLNGPSENDQAQDLRQQAYAN